MSIMSVESIKSSGAYRSTIKYDERKLVGTKGNHPLRLSIINLAIVNSTVKEMVKNLL